MSQEKAAALQSYAQRLKACADTIKALLPSRFSQDPPPPKAGRYLGIPDRSQIQEQLDLIKKIGEEITALQPDQHIQDTISLLYKSVQNISEKLPGRRGDICVPVGNEIKKELHNIARYAYTISPLFAENDPDSASVLLQSSQESAVEPPKNKKGGRDKKIDYIKDSSPSLSLSEWHVLYWWPDIAYVDSSQIKQGLSTLAIVLIGDINTSQQVWFARNNIWFETQLFVRLYEDEKALFTSYGYIERRHDKGDEGDKENVLLDALTRRIAQVAGFEKKKKEREKEGEKKESAFYAMSIQEQITHMQEYGVEHAARRVDLFFYLLVYYYKQPPTVITIGDTYLQFGQGVGGITQAAHSAPLPSLIDGTQSYGHDTYSGGDSKEAWSLADKTFAEILNSTVELPTWFNHFDNHYVEKYLREKAVLFLNQVSQKKITPVEALTHFFLFMEAHLVGIKRKYLENSEAQEQSPTEVRITVYEAEWEGTFSGKWDTQKKQCNPSYIASLLRTSEEAYASGASHTAERYTEIHREISSSFSAHPSSGAVVPKPVLFPQQSTLQKNAASVPPIQAAPLHASTHAPQAFFSSTMRVSAPSLSPTQHVGVDNLVQAIQRDIHSLQPHNAVQADDYQRELNTLTQQVAAALDMRQLNTLAQRLQTSLATSEKSFSR